MLFFRVVGIFFALQATMLECLIPQNIYDKLTSLLVMTPFLVCDEPAMSGTFFGDICVL